MPKKQLSIVVLLPIAVIALQAVRYATSGPVFEIGISRPGQIRGNETRLVYTSASFDEAVLLNWLEEKSYLGRPWMNPNNQHVAIVFTNDMQMIKWGQFDQLSDYNTVATICLYEEDQAVIAHQSLFDCFAERNTVQEEIAATVARAATGLGNDVDDWYARSLICDQVELPDDSYSDIEIIGMCRSQIRSYPRSLQRFIERYGEDSDPVTFVRAEAESREYE